MSAFDRWPFTNEGNPFDTAEWRDKMAAAEAAGDSGVVVEVDNDVTIVQHVRNVSSGSAVVGFQAGTVIGRGQAAQTVVGGRIMDNGKAKTCSTCGGQSGWVIQEGLEIHTGGGCGARQ